METKFEAPKKYNISVSNSEMDNCRDARSDKIQKLLHQRPHPILMWGNLVLLIIFLGIAIFLYLTNS